MSLQSILTLKYFCEASFRWDKILQRIFRFSHRFCTSENHIFDVVLVLLTLITFHSAWFIDIITTKNNQLERNFK